jgi:hypothetical protein
MSEHPGKKALKGLRNRGKGLRGATIGVVDAMKELEAIASYVSDLEARLEKAKAERDALKALAERQLGQMIEKAAQARNDALEEAAQVVKNEPMRFAGQTESYVRASLSSAIRALKDKS